MRVELTVKYFSREDLADLNTWLAARSMPPLELKDLPPIGFVAAEDEEKVVMCFLRRCEGGLGIIDGLCTNPAVHSIVRNAAIDLVVRLVCEEAKQRGITKMISWTQDTGTLTRAITSHGFRKLPDSLMVKDLVEAQQHH